MVLETLSRWWLSAQSGSAHIGSRSAAGVQSFRPALAGIIGARREFTARMNSQFSLEFSICGDRGRGVGTARERRLTIGDADGFETRRCVMSSIASIC